MYLLEAIQLSIKREMDKQMVYVHRLLLNKKEWTIDTHNLAYSQNSCADRSQIREKKDYTLYDSVCTQL